MKISKSASAVALCQVISCLLLPVVGTAANTSSPDFTDLLGISTWDQSAWSLTTQTFLPGHYQSRIALANGYVGAALSAAGPFFEADVETTNGWPLFNPRISFSTISGFYNIQAKAQGTNYPWLDQYGWDSFIAGIPFPTGLVFAVGDQWLDASVSTDSVTGFVQTISFRSGEAKWAYTWTPAGSQTTFNMEYAVIFSRTRPHVIAVKATITASEHANGTITDLLDGRSAVRSRLVNKGANGTTIFSAVSPDSLPQVTGWVVSEADVPLAEGPPRAASGPYVSSDESTIGQTFDICLEAGKPMTMYKYVGVASTDKFPDPEGVARDAVRAAKADGWDTLLAEHVAAWNNLMQEESVDNFSDPDTHALPNDTNIQILQIASVASTFYLLQNLQPEGSGLNDNSVSVGGLASDSYAGMVFWDADTWMAPGLNLAFPEFAKQIPAFRVKQHPQALSNAKFNGYPDGSSLYSWTAGRYGNCTATGPCVDYEYHLNYDIAFNLLQLRNITGDDAWFSHGPEQIVLSTAAMTARLLQYNQTEGTYWLRNATDPDEYANNVDNPAFTIASASELLLRANELLVERGKPADTTWATIADKIAFPRAASNITLEFETMNNNVEVKQADVVLLTYPLGYSKDYTAENQLLDLNYYSIKQSPNGPAMTFSVFAAAANAVSPSGCAAYTYALKAFTPYLRAPWYQFSEQQVDDPTKNGGTNPAFPFLTGHGGALQVAPFGFLGIRTDQKVLFLDPSLPPQIPHLQIRTFYWGGATFRAAMNSTHTALTRVPSPWWLRDTFGDRPVPFVVGSADAPDGQRAYSIAVQQTVTFPNRVYWQKKTVPDNMFQCLPVTSPDPYVAGQLPESAIDGAAATAWQPATNKQARLLIDMRSVEPRKLKGMFFDFGLRPISNATVLLYNETGGVETGVEFAINGIKPSEPPVITLNVEPEPSNQTVVVFADNLSIYTGDWAQLTIEGCTGCDESEVAGLGATIGEWAAY